MTIEVYPSPMEGAPIEVYEAGNTTLGGWLNSMGWAYQSFDDQRVIIKVNGIEVSQDKWEQYHFTSSDRIELYPIPHGGAFSALGSIIGKVLNLALGWMVPRAHSSGTGNSEQGKSLDPSQATANQARLGEAVPEIAGTYKRYLDYLTPPHRFFENMRSQRLQFLGCVGPGRYELDAEGLKIGDTPFSSFGYAADFSIYEPGADLSGVLTAQHWHTTQEVGGTSSGTPGLTLSTEVTNRENVPSTTTSTAGNNITRSDGEWPAAWGVGTIIHVQWQRPYDVVTVNVPGSTPYDVSEITGHFAHTGPVTVGSLVSLGPIGNTKEYRILTRVDLGSGRYTVRLADPDTSSVIPLVLTPGVGVSLMFGSNIDRTVTSVADKVLTVSPGSFQSGAISGIYRFIFAGGAAYGEWTSEFVSTPGKEKAQELEIDVFFPKGLGRLSGSGVNSHTVSMVIEYRDIDSSLVKTITKTYTQATVDQIGFTEKIALPYAMRPAVRLRRVTPSSTSTELLDECVWYGLKARLPIRHVYPNWTTASVTLLSGGRIAAQSENQINGVFTRILPSVLTNGSIGTPSATNQIAPFFRHIVSTLPDAGDDAILMQDLGRLNDVWSARGDVFNHIFTETTVKAALDAALAAGMSELCIESGLLRPVRDERRTVFEQAYSAQNTKAPIQITTRHHQPSDIDGVEVEYTDINTWTKITVKCLLPGDQDLKMESLKLIGAFDRTRAWRIGMRRRRELEYRRREFSFTTEMDALNSRYLSRVPLIDEDRAYSQSAIMVRISRQGEQALVRVTERLTWLEGQSHVVAYRDPDGKLVGPFTAYPGPDDYSVLADIPEPYPVVTLKHEPPHVFFGTATMWCYPALIKSITPQELDSISVVAIEDHPAVYDDDDASPPA